jgi:hypothetical protein
LLAALTSDFVDPDIEKHLQQLEREEDELQAKAAMAVLCPFFPLSLFVGLNCMLSAVRCAFWLRGLFLAFRRLALCSDASLRRISYSDPLCGQTLGSC